MALCVHYTQPAVSVFKRESLVSKLQAILSCHRDEDVDNEIFFFPFFVLKIEELKNENALLRAQLQQHGIEMVGETPPQWSGDRMNREGHHHPDIQPIGLKKNKDLWRITFILVNASSPWVPRARSLHRPIVAVLDCSNPIEITTRYNSAEMCSEKRWPLTTIRVLFSHYLWKRRSSERLPCFVFM